MAPFDDETRVPRPPPISPTIAPIRARLTITRSSDAAQIGRVFPIRGDATITVGRDPANLVALSDPETSRYHAQIATSGDEVVLLDLESRNGTHVNTSRVKEARLKTGDVIVIGSTAMVYERV